MNYKVTEDIFTKILEFFMPHLGVHTRVGSIYLLYAIYSIQPSVGVNAKVNLYLAIHFTTVLCNIKYYFIYFNNFLSYILFFH